jgi:hypothetical protein
MLLGTFIIMGWCPEGTASTAGEWEETNIFASNLRVEYDPPEDIMVAVGGKRVTTWQTYTSGEVDPNVYRATADISFRFESYILTTVSGDAVLAIGEKTTQELTWLDFYTRSTVILMPDDWTHTDYSIKYYHYDFPVPSEFNGFGLEGFLPFKPALVDLRPEALSFTEGNYTFETHNFDSTLQDHTVNVVGHYDVADYQDYFWGQESSAEFDRIVNIREEEEALKTSLLDFLGRETANVDQEAEQYMEDHNIGVTQGEITESKMTSADNDLESTVPEGLYLDLQPAISVYNQEITGNYGHLIFDTEGADEGLVFETTKYGTTYHTPIERERVIGIHCKNQLIHLESEVTFRVKSDVEISARHLSDQEDLDMPLYQLSDRYYNALLFGDISGDLLYRDPDFWEQAKKWGGISLALLAGLALLYFFQPLISGQLVFWQEQIADRQRNR